MKKGDKAYIEVSIMEDCEDGTHKVSTSGSAVIFVGDTFLNKAINPDPRWQPMDTAPKDRGILLHDKMHGVHTGNFVVTDDETNEGYWVIGDVDDWMDGMDCEPTHWMEKPNGPGKTDD